MNSDMLFIQKVALLTLLILSCLVAVRAQDQPTSAWATDVGSRYWVQPDIVYQGANSSLLKLDVWYQHDVKTPSPALSRKGLDGRQCRVSHGQQFVGARGSGRH